MAEISKYDIVRIIKFLKVRARILIIVISLLLYHSATAQQSESDSLMVVTQYGKRIFNQIGLYGSYNFLFHSAAFRNLPGIPNCCNDFDGGSGSGFSLGALTNIRFNDMFGFNIRAGYRTGSALLLKDQFLDIGVNGVNYLGKDQHTINLDRSSYDLMGLLTVRAYENVFGYIGASIDFRSTPTFHQKEELIEPKNVGTFENGKRIRNDTSGALPHAVGQGYSIIAGIGYDLPLNDSKSLFLCPEIMFNYSLTPLIENYDWYEHALTLGLSIKYQFPERMPDTTYPSFLRMESFEVDTNNKELTNIPIVAEEFRSNGQLIKTTLNPPIIRFYSEFISHNTIRHWEISITQGDSVIRKIEGDGNIPEKLEWNIHEDTSKIFASTKPVKYCLSMTDSKDNTYKTEPGEFALSRKTNDIDVDLETEFYDDKGNKLNTDTITIDQTISTNLRPLLNYIFFDKNSAVIPERYERIKSEETDSFRIEQLRGLSELETYYKVLNIFGRRLRDSSQAQILITGCNSDIGVEEGNVALSRMRAESVKRYLVKVWKIEDKRISIKSWNAPKNESITSEKEFHDEVRDENRRVEISSDYDEIMQPVVTFDTLKSFSSSSIKFIPKLKNNKSTAKSALKLNIGEHVIEDTASVGSEMAPISINTKKYNYFYKDNESLDYKFESVSEDGIVSTKEGSLYIKIHTKDSTLDKYSLILFDFNSHNISDANSKIADYINSRIAKDASGNIAGTVEISGFTDNIGSESYNMDLSTRRANSLFEFMKLPKEKVSVKGIGESSLLYPVDTPEGRFYCRTVTIIVKNPRIKK